MKKIIYLPVLFFITAVSFAQTNVKPAAAGKPVQAIMKKVAELQMPRTPDDDYPGKRGASVVWHPVQKKYYAAMAGNALFPLAVFDIKGKRLSHDSLSCGIDTRGLWYDIYRKTICGNGYSDKGWFAHRLNAAGIPVKTDTIYSGQNQPTDQCVGAYNFKQKTILFLDGSIIYAYDASTAEISTETLQLQWGRTKNDGPDEDDADAKPNADYNYTTIIYTGLPGAEMGVLNYAAKKIELYDSKDGLLKKTMKLPDNAVTYESFNFAYTNGIWWLFDIDTRKWTGYK